MHLWLWKIPISLVCPPNSRSHFTPASLALSLHPPLLCIAKQAVVDKWHQWKRQSLCLSVREGFSFWFSFSYFTFLLFLSGGDVGEKKLCESVNVFHSPDIIHKFNKAGIWSIRWDHCAIEGGWKGLIQASLEKIALSTTLVESKVE